MYESLGGEVTVAWEGQEKLYGEMRIGLGPRMIKIHISHTGEGGTEQGCRREECKRQIWEGVS